MVRKALVFCFQALTTKPDIVINYVKIFVPIVTTLAKTRNPPLNIRAAHDH